MVSGIIGINFALSSGAWYDLNGICDAFSKTYNWQSQIPTSSGTMINNPINKSDFTIKCVQQYVSDVWSAYSVDINTALFKTSVVNTVKTTSDTITSGTKVSIL